MNSEPPSGRASAPHPRPATAWILGTVWCLAGSGCLLPAATVLLDDFEAPTAPAPWTFSNGAEFPGATGSLARASGRVGSGLRLNYDFSGGGAYVAANLNLPMPLTGYAVRFWVKWPASILVRMRVMDNSGQWLQYEPVRPLSAGDPTEWCRVVAPLDASKGWWSGANDGQVHFPIRRLSLLADKGFEPGVVGAVDFDDVELLDAAPLALDPLRLPTLAALPDAGSLAARLGVNIHFTSDDRALDAARSAGIRWIRMDLTWSSVEPQTNVFNWSAFEGLVTALEARGMKTLFILDYGHPVYTGGNAPTNEAQIEAFARYAETAARRFAGRDVVFEIWNEPNIGFWKPAPDTNQYAALARAVIPRVKAADPAARILTGGLAGFDFSFARGFLALGGGDGADGVGIHPYHRAAESLGQNLPYLREVVRRFVTNNPPVWDSEWGLSSTWYGDGHAPETRHQQAMQVPRRLMASWAGGLPLMIYYDIRDDGLESTNAEHNFGLLARDYTDKPAMQAVRTLSAVASNRVLTGCLPLDTASATAVRLDGRSNVVVALWPHSGTDNLELRLPAGTTAMDLLGRPLHLSADGEALALTVRQTNAPVYFAFAAPGRATNVTLVSTGAVWRYLDTGTNLGTNWVAPAFNDSAWRSGPAPLGYGETYLGTTVGYGTNANNRYITTYFRRSFVVTGAHAFRELWLRLLRDDGAVVYLNGRLVFANNLPGWPSFTNLALVTVSGAEETNWLVNSLAPSLLVEGTNVLAVEIHQSGPTSSDLAFDLELRGTRVALPPTVANLPPLTVCAAGANLRLPVEHDGLTPCRSQWWFEGTNQLAGQTNATLWLAGAQTNLAGRYHVVVSNAFGSVTSAAARVIVATSLATNSSLVPTGAVWRYLDTGADPGPAWAGVDFHDAAWRSGPAPLGYGEANLGTTVSYGTNASAKHITTWFRRAFVVSDPAAFASLTVRLRRDDGAAVYLNGEELLRDNLPSGTLTPATLASGTVGGSDETNFFVFTLPPWALRAGTNLLAAEVHQAAADSSDLSFDLELRGAQTLLAPYVVEGPHSQTVAVGGAVTLNAQVGGSGPLRYQWQKDGTNLPAATNLAVVLSNVTFAQAGAYALRVSNAVGLATSPAATVRVIAPPSLDIAWAAGQPLTLSFTAPAGVGCVVFASTNLVTWQVLTNLVGTGAPVQVTDPQALLWPQCFYRVRLDDLPGGAAGP